MKTVYSKAVQDTRLKSRHMKTSISIVLGCSLAAFAAGPFVIEKTDPAAAGMDPARLARIPARMKEFVAAGKTAGVVTLVARHGHVASLEAVGYQDLESKTPMRPTPSSVSRRSPSRSRAPAS